MPRLLLVFTACVRGMNARLWRDGVRSRRNRHTGAVRRHRQKNRVKAQYAERIRIGRRRYGRRSAVPSLHNGTPALMRGRE